MTEKQIIIDGTQCRYASFDGGNTQRLLCAIDDCFCDCYRENECYYKQLKHSEQRIVELNKTIKAKEQECEELKKERDSWEYQWDKRYEMCECLSDQLDQLKEQLEAYKMEAEEGKEINAELKAENEELKKYIKHLHNLCGSETDKQYKLKQTLTEIKEIAEDESYIGFWDEQISEILQKISEVLE